jgi:hypothetical protein
MLQSSRHLLLSVSLLTVSLLVANACRGRHQEPRAPQYTTDATIKDLMDSMVDPSADVVWESVAVEVSAAGTVERAPRTDEEWAKVRQGAIRLVEATNLLMMPGRHVARAHEKSEVPGVELEPEEMEAMIKKDPLAWRSRAKALHDASLLALNAIDAKDAKTLGDMGERIDGACENCHVQYWYPNQVLPPGYEEPAPVHRPRAAPDKP